MEDWPKTVSSGQGRTAQMDSWRLWVPAQCQASQYSSPGRGEANCAFPLTEELAGGIWGMETQPSVSVWPLVEWPCSRVWMVLHPLVFGQHKVNSVDYWGT